MTTVLVTGAGGFVGRNLLEGLRRRPEVKIQTTEAETAVDAWDDHLRAADVVFHLAGVNRAPAEADFQAGNTELTQWLGERLIQLGRAPKIVFSSSIQAALDNPYGQSKLAAEQALRRYAEASGAEVAIYRLKNLFGKWCRPNYNSVVATFCHNIARDLPIQISDPGRALELVYIDDVVEAFLEELTPRGPGASTREIAVSHHATLGRLAELLAAFQASRKTLVMPDLSDALTKKLYATFLTYLPEEQFAYPLQHKVDDRGDLAEFIKSAQMGQIFISRTKPGITRGNHFHHTKAEKFLVLSGEAIIRFRHVQREDVLEYRVHGGQFRVVDIPPGYTHSIENVGPGEMTVLFWASEVFDPQRADTYFQKVA